MHLQRRPDSISTTKLMDNAMTSLPVPKQWALKKMNEYEVAEMLEKYIDFVNKDGQSVHCPTPFVRHYMNRDDGALPTMVAISTLPIVLADGNLLAPKGLDRPRGIVFQIEPELRKLIPDREECDADAVRKAMRFLTEVWMADVATDYAGRCALIAMALTMIERSLLDQRPTWFVTAGRRGSGKTTAITILIEAVTGIAPAAAAWSTNEEERRKALLSFFMAGCVYILWDNITRGSQISCPHIEKSCTAAYYADRKLGVSEMVATAASTIHCFTGNNIAPKGDLSSRSLQVRLDVDRIDPENREFKHPDVIQWTRDNRAELLRAMYVILMGNPTLNLPPDAQMKTRFKMWWRLVGSAVENAAKLHSGAIDSAAYDAEDGRKPKAIDFGSMFLDLEEDDEEQASLGHALHTMQKQWGGLQKGFRASEVVEWLNNAGTPPAPNAVALRGFFYPAAPATAAADPLTIGKKLGAHVGEVVPYNGRSLVLRRMAKSEKTKVAAHYFVADLGGEEENRGL
jgi:hypothetical protein